MEIVCKIRENNLIAKEQGNFSVKIEQILFDSQHKADMKERQLCMQQDHFYLYELSFPNKYSRVINKI